MIAEFLNLNKKIRLFRLGGGMDWEFGVSRCKLLHIEWINNKALLYSTGNCIQYPAINHNGKEYKTMYLNITESFCCAAEINTL